MILLAIYLIIGCVLARRHALDIAVEATDHGLVTTAVRWIITWPTWVLR